jgi:hypothetical protein
VNGRYVQVRPVDADHRVVTIVSDADSHPYRRQPCSPNPDLPEAAPVRWGCPWRVDQTGAFPAEAFAASAHTAYDMSDRLFGCHQSDHRRPATCAGFLLRGAEHNLAVRRAVMAGQIDPGQVSDGGHQLHEDYRTMAVANGMDPHDERLARCRGME